MARTLLIKQVPSHNRYRHFFIGLFLVLLISFVIAIMIHLLPIAVYERSREVYKHISLKNIDVLPEAFIPSNSHVSDPRDPRCTYYDCFNVYNCGTKGTDQIYVYVYPLKKYVDDKGIPLGSQMSREFYFILQSILESRYYTPNPHEACILVPSIDTLNQNRFRTAETSQALASLQL